MSLIPVFDIGLWNAWIFELCALLPLPILLLIRKRRALKSERGADSKSELDYMTKTEKRLFGFSRIVMFLPIIYSIFLPLKLGTTWFYVGLPIALVGLIMLLTVWVNFATTPFDDEPITTGLYRYSRHPMYLTSFLMYIGIGIACASWLFLLLSIASVLFANVRFAGFEERLCLEKYGATYREYMDRTPKWLGSPKLEREVN
jgi:protein-S-isoprenylcysteine O-methyltransferase Ste14